MERKKVLYVATVDMFTRTGGGIATLAFYNAYKDIYKERLVLMHAYEYYKGQSSDNVVLTPHKSIIKWGLNLISGHVHRFYPDIYKYLKMHCNEYGECIINGGVYGGDSIHKIQELGIKVTIIHHNFERQYHLDNKTIATFYGRSAMWINKWEKISYKNADNNIFLTQSDFKLFKEEYGECRGKCAVIGCFMPDNNIKLNYSNTVENRHDSTTIITSGALNYPQSYNSIINFYETIYKDIRSENLKYVLTGRHPHPTLNYLSSDSTVKIIPSPDDIYEIIRAADIYVCPLDVGGGIKMRIMDGLICGKPIITHINSIRGYEYFMDKPYFATYSTPVEFMTVYHQILDKINNHSYNSEEIIEDFNNYFSLSAGICRLSKFLNSN